MHRDELKNALHRVIRDCDSALQIDPSYLKASCRKAQTLVTLESFEEARQLITEILLVHPDESSLHKLLEEVNAKLPQEQPTVVELDKEALLEME